ncbi:MAG: sensor domain-containing diguanylate cyclase [Deltaproteobacteria bacterium]|nr:sensor domain-containing diguanylate cyclase [Deltaproteobacteria bacterium]
MELTGYAREEVVGSRCSDNILVHVDHQGNSLCASGCPLAATMSDGKNRETQVFMSHKDGHRVLVSVRTTPLHDSEGRIIGAVEIFRDLSHQEAMYKKMKQLENLALLDPLTRLANRRHIETSLQSRLEELTRYGWPFGVLFIDIDHFKEINDSNGHNVGDKVLKLVSLTLLNSLRPFDFLGRWGGEEFVAIVVNVDKRKLTYIADRARSLIEQSTLKLGDLSIPVTVSIGATLAKAGDTTESLLNRADALMYRAKAHGRNQVTADYHPIKSH